uniref:Uncharacterized protein n=1 Tax=Cacopsylla melanoneura TaxID=428564 RepID=A0A8D9AGG9_9HEMI
MDVRRFLFHAPMLGEEVANSLTRFPEEDEQVDDPDVVYSPLVLPVVYPLPQSPLQSPPLQSPSRSRPLAAPLRRESFFSSSNFTAWRVTGALFHPNSSSIVQMC